MQNGTVVEHTYDADGNRVRTSVNGVPTNYLVDTCGGGSCNGSLSHVVAETNGIDALQALYIRLGDELLAVMRPDGHGGWVTWWVHHDGIGSVRALTDEAGVVSDTRAYEAFGTQNTSAGTDPLTYGFAGESFQAESKLAYHRARWMDARVGRFVGVDPVRGRTAEPLTVNRYLYGSDNPISRIDPTGREDLVSLGAAGIGVSIMASMGCVSGRSVLGRAGFYVKTGPISGNLPWCVRAYLLPYFIFSPQVELGSIRLERVPMSPGHLGTYGGDWNPKTGAATIYLSNNPDLDVLSPAGVSVIAHEVRHVEQHTEHPSTYFADTFKSNFFQQTWADYASDEYEAPALSLQDKVKADMEAHYAEFIENCQ